ncbi:hypothetical protein ACFPOU_14480 [Massilia jejuensis]|uniref:Uncharacterized protein n=1 Tax=Massilia jejuensis TaxID=648894 RepID=A0ABW0PJZ2_9BURK
MQNARKFRTGAARLHAALAETDPASIDLILVGAAGYTPALRAPGTAAPGPRPARACHAPPACARTGPMLAHSARPWRQRPFVARKATAPT